MRVSLEKLPEKELKREGEEKIGSSRTFRGHADFQPAGEPGHAVGKSPIDNGDEEVHLKGPDFTLADRLGGLGQIHHADDRSKGCVFKKDNELGDQGGDHIAYGLGKDDTPHGLGIA